MTTTRHVSPLDTPSVDDARGLDPGMATLLGMSRALGLVVEASDPGPTCA